MRNTHKADHEGRRPSRLPVIIAIVAVLAAAIGVGVYGLLRTPNEPAETPNPGPSATVKTTATPMPTSTTSAGMTDSEAFARWAASALFDWDTATMNPSDVTDQLIAAADPTGEGEGAGLASDIGNYLPDPATWAKLRTYATRQWLDIDTVTVPKTWADATTQATPGQMLPGTTAYTITGTRHREGIWGTQPVTYTGPAAFTMFVTCAPSFPECHLLRLSLPDEPLK